jgi:serine/threonine-protein kinase RsbT
MEECDFEVALLSSLDIARVRQHVRQLAEINGFSAVKQTKFVTAASELARNAVKYAHGSSVKWTRLSAHDRVGIKVVFEDKGPGIANLRFALSDGWSSGGGLGLGLPGARRLVDEFTLESIVGVGTRVEIIMWK